MGVALQWMTRMIEVCFENKGSREERSLVFDVF